MVDLVESDPILSDEITLIPTPGHSPGHMSVHINSEGEEGLLTGDVVHHPCQMAHLDWSSTADTDPKQSAETRRELFSWFADTPSLVIGGHFDAGHIKREGDAFRFVALGIRRANHETQPVGTAQGLLCPPYPALSAVEFPRPLFHEAFQANKPRPRGSAK